jgi:hypothetical protein
MTVQVFRSTASGAPSYTNVAGSLIGVLDFCLPGLGWGRTALGTNKVAYTQPSGSNGLIMQVDDTNAAYAVITGWKTLTSFNTGTGLFYPGSSATAYVNHCSTSTPAAWRLFTNGSIFHFTTYWNVGASYSDLFTFGDYISYVPNDLYGTIIAGNYNVSSQYLGYMGSGLNTQWSAASGYSGQARSYNQINVNPGSSLITDVAKLGNSPTSAGANATPYPDPISGKLNLSPVWVCETTAGSNRGGLRGLLPGVWTLIAKNAPFNDGDTFTAGAGPISGRTFEIVGLNATTNGQCAIETSNTWGGF